MGQGFQLIIEARWNEKWLINFRNIAQKQIPPLDPVGPGVRWTLKNKILLCKTTARSKFCLLAPSQFFKLLPSFGGVDPAGPGLEWAPTNRNLPGKLTPRSNFCLLSHTQLFKKNTLIWWGGPCKPLVWVSPLQIKFYQANPLQGATFVCWPPPYSHCKHLHLVEWTLRARGWGEPPKLNYPSKPTLRSKFCLLDPAQLLIHQGISDRVTLRGTLGADILGRPLARCLIS
jgi:hypothetical protein